jgi:uncharacterized protein
MLMTGSWDVPELDRPSSVIRISPEINVPVTPRVKRLIDTAAFRRLTRISQLGLVAFVYPGATHTRFEHSLGVYRNAIEFMQRFAHDPVLRSLLTDEHVKLFLVAALLHDIGHWPFCHALEDMHLEGLPRHELLARRLLTQGEIAGVIESDWQLDPMAVAKLLALTIHGESNPPFDRAGQALQSMLSGPIDIDKLDYLERDSLHAGVPYGRNFDRNRLVSSLCFHAGRNRLAISDKGKTAAEMMVFARYVMFSEVYWHHAVRSATAMLQRAVYEMRNEHSLTHSWIDMNEMQMIESLLGASQHQPWSACIDGLFGPQRKLYKRVAQFDYLSHPQQHAFLSRKPYHEIHALSLRLTQMLNDRHGLRLGQFDLLIDAPPVKLEVQFHLDVLQRDGSYRTLEELSPVVHALATKQFDDLVKRVRILVSPEARAQVEGIDFAKIILELLDHAQTSADYSEPDA